MVLLLELEACAVVAGAEQRTASAGHENVARPIRRVADGGVCWSPGGVWRRPARLRSSTVQIKRRCRCMFSYSQNSAQQSDSYLLPVLFIFSKQFNKFSRFHRLYVILYYDDNRFQLSSQTPQL